MRLISIFQNANMELQSFCEYLLSDNRAKNALCVALKKNPNLIDDYIVNRVLDEAIFLHIIELGARRKKWSSILWEIINIVDASCISVSIFDALATFPNLNARASFLVLLCHKNLPERELRYLCGMEITHECYYELGILYYIDVTYSSSTFEDFLEWFSHSKFSAEMVYFFMELDSLEPSSTEKKGIAEVWKKQ